MLDKRVCKKCRDNDPHSDSRWFTSADEEWDRGIVLCTHRPHRLFIPVKYPPPQWCPYALNHALAGAHDAK